MVELRKSLSRFARPFVSRALAALDFGPNRESLNAGYRSLRRYWHLPDCIIKKKQQNKDYDSLRSLRKKNFPSPFQNSLGTFRNCRSSYHLDISPSSREIKMNVSLARRKLMNEPSRYGGATADHSTSGAAVRQLGRIIQRIFLPNQEAALVEPLLPRGFFHLLVVVWYYISLPDVFPPGSTNCPWVCEDDRAKVTAVANWCAFSMGMKSLAWI